MFSLGLIGKKDHSEASRFMIVVHEIKVLGLDNLLNWTTYHTLDFDV